MYVQLYDKMYVRVHIKPSTSGFANQSKIICKLIKVLGIHPLKIIFLRSQTLWCFNIQTSQKHSVIFFIFFGVFCVEIEQIRGCSVSI